MCEIIGEFMCLAGFLRKQHWRQTIQIKGIISAPATIMPAITGHLCAFLSVARPGCQSWIERISCIVPAMVFGQASIPAASKVEVTSGQLRSHFC